MEKRGGDKGGRSTKDQEKREGQRSLKKGRDSRQAEKEKRKIRRAEKKGRGE